VGGELARKLSLQPPSVLELAQVLWRCADDEAWTVPPWFHRSSLDLSLTACAQVRDAALGALAEIGLHHSAALTPAALRDLVRVVVTRLADSMPLPVRVCSLSLFLSAHH
jgi:hypothetical protein